ncbi:hypothetical protein [Thioclava sp. GXIMD2076]|uniref:hypothetical protein n=1 Tax=Thioclava sp. GXIMD2076 TaxID=3131931 RepID=UPI0030D439A1
MVRIQARYFFAEGTLDKPAAWGAICDWLEHVRPGRAVFVDQNEKWLTPRELRPRAARMASRHLRVETDNLIPPNFTYPPNAISVGSGRIGRYNLDRVFIESPDSAIQDSLLEALAGCGTLVLSGIFNEDYDRWQNAKDPLIYIHAGRSLEGLPLISNGMPPPLLQDIVDISDHPGRYHYDQRGFPETVAGRMWIGPELWKRLGEDRTEDVLALQDYLVQMQADGTLTLKWNGGLFDNATPVSVQNALRRAVFMPNDKEK